MVKKIWKYIICYVELGRKLYSLFWRVICNASVQDFTNYVARKPPNTTRQKRNNSPLDSNILTHRSSIRFRKSLKFFSLLASSSSIKLIEHNHICEVTAKPGLFVFIYEADTQTINAKPRGSENMTRALQYVLLCFSSKPLSCSLKLFFNKASAKWPWLFWQRLNIFQEPDGASLYFKDRI